MSGYVEYDSNNSGGRWWLDDDQWKALEAAGWRVEWKTLENLYDASGGHVRDDAGLPVLVPRGQGNSRWGALSSPDADGRWLGALATAATRAGLPLREAVAEWERVTGESSTDAGCACCGQPHSFTERDADGKYLRSGPEISYRAEWV